MGLNAVQRLLDAKSPRDGMDPHFVSALFRAYAEPDEPERPFKVGDEVESIMSKEWAGPMTVERIFLKGKDAKCRHPVHGVGNFDWSDLRLYVPLQPGEEVEIEGMRPFVPGYGILRPRFTAGLGNRPAPDGFITIVVRDGLTVAESAFCYVRADLVRRKS